MIVVVGSVAWRETPAGPAGRACGIALAAATRGAHTEIVGRVGDDPAGDALVIALGQAGVGHAALLRDPVHGTPILAPEPDSESDAELADLLADGARGPGSAILGGPRLEPADVALGLQYLTAFAVLVVVDDVPTDALPACVEGAAFAGAHLVVLVPAGRPPAGAIPADATVLAAPDTEDEGAFAALVGAYAAAIDAGDAPAAAFAAATGAAGWETARPA